MAELGKANTGREATGAVEALTARITAGLDFADAVWRSGDAARLSEALRVCDEAWALLAEPATSEIADVATRVRFEATLCLKRGHLHEARATGGAVAEALTEALRDYDRAVVVLQKTAETDDADVALLAGAWMNRGNVLQRLGSEAERVEAVRSYDCAITLLGAPAPAFGLGEEEGAARAVTFGAAWLNRGVACRHGGGETARAEAVRSFERAITELAPLAASHPAARRNLASAWTNLGLLRLDGKDARGAVAAHEAALRITAATGNDLVAIALNLGAARREAGEHAEALELFREAGVALAPRETTDATAAELALRARHAACVTLGEQLAAEGETVTEATSVRLAEAAALVSGGLALVRAWGVRAGWFREPGGRLFEFGAWLYGTYGTGQLAPYLQAELEPVDAWRIEIAREAVERARQELLQRGFEELMGEAAERITAELADLRAVDERLRELVARVNADRRS